MSSADGGRAGMASVEDCEQALHALAGRLAGVDPDVRSRHAVERTISVEVTDLALTFTGLLSGGTLQAISREPAERAQIRLFCRSDDLVALTSGELNFANAWATGRLRVDANPLDLLRLRALL